MTTGEPHGAPSGPPTDAPARGPKRGSRRGRWLVSTLVALLAVGGVTAWRLDLVPSHLAFSLEPSSGPTSDGPTSDGPTTDDPTTGGAATGDPTAGAAADPAPVVLGVTLPDPPPVEPPAPGFDRADTGSVDPAAVAQAVAADLADPDLGRHVVVRIADLSTGRTVFESGTGPLLPASTTKLLTATAALSVLGPDRVFSTRVVTGSRAGDIVLVGGGDPYLLSRPVPRELADEVYPERADVQALAAGTARSLRAQGTLRVRLGYDASLFEGPAAAPTWEPDYLPDEVVAPISALWVDEGRPRSGYGRVADPAARAALVFSRALAREGIKVLGPPREAVASTGADLLAQVDSAPVARIVERVLEVSDNEAAEVLAHQVGLEGVGEGSFAGGVAGVTDALRRLGVPLAGMALYDGSGLSRADRLGPETLLSVLRLAADPAHPELRPVLAGLPVAGFTGSLAERFTEGAPAGLGGVRAKTGTLTGVSALAGLATDRDGSTMVFVMAADRVRLPDTLDAREALDRLAAALAGCHCSR